MKISSIYKRYLILSISISILIFISIATVIVSDYKLLTNTRLLHHSKEAQEIANDIEANFNFIEEFSGIMGRKISDNGTNDPMFINEIFTKNLPMSFINKDVLYLTLFDFVTPDGKVIASSLEGVIPNPPIVKKEQRKWMELAPKEPWKMHLSQPDKGITSSDQLCSYIIPAGIGITDHHGTFLGMISTGLEVGKMYSKANQAKFSPNSSFLLFSEDLQLISPHQEDRDFFQDKLISSMIQGQAGILPNEIEYKGSKYSFYRKIKNWPFIILVGEDSTALQNEFNNIVIPHVIQITIIACLMFIFFYIVRRQIIFPIVDLAKITKNIANGNTNIDIPIYNNTEMNLLAEELLRVKDYTSELKTTRDKLEHVQTILQSSNQILEEKVKERTTSLEKALAAKTEFLNNMSHEIRTPIQGITAISEGLAEHWSELNEEKRFAYAKQVAISAQRLFSLVGNLLDMAKFSANKILLDLKEMDFNDLVIEMIEECKILYLRDKNIQLIFNKDKPLYIVADRERLTQVLRNLFANAIKFSANNTKITANVVPTIISFDHKNSKGNKYRVAAIHFTLEDQGIGVPEGELEEIFETFNQSSKTKTKAGGTGLGLSIAKEIILAHHGKIWVESNEEGSKFHFIIPVTQA